MTASVELLLLLYLPQVVTVHFEACVLQYRNLVYCTLKRAKLTTKLHVLLLVSEQLGPA